MLTCKARICARIATLGLVVLASAAQASTGIATRAEHDAGPRGWSAIADMDPRQVRDMARSLPISDDATGDQPWCDSDASIEAALSHDFGEERVAAGAENTALWGSDIMGTWTMVLERSDATSCVIASGIGYDKDTSPRSYFINAGFSG